jgi:hypothetical protein
LSKFLSYIIYLWVWNIMFYIVLCQWKQWKYIHSGHWWSNYNIYICIQEHPCCIFECKSFNDIKVFNNQPIQKVHFQNKLILDCLIFDITTYKWKFVWCNSNTYLCVGLSHVWGLKWPKIKGATTCKRIWLNKIQTNADVLFWVQKETLMSSYIVIWNILCVHLRWTLWNQPMCMLLNLKNRLIRLNSKGGFKFHLQNVLSRSMYYWTDLFKLHRRWHSKTLLESETKNPMRTKYQIKKVW